MDEILDEKTYETREVKPADFITRLAAFAVDIIIFIILSYGLNYAFKISASYAAFLQLYWWQILIIISFYFIYFDGSESNATLGKQIMNIRLLTEEKRDVNFSNSAKHYALSVLLFFGYFSILMNEKKQTTADTFCKVIVVKVR
jgi:uncharacterized RDD family membrane protein YckC